MNCPYCRLPMLRAALNVCARDAAGLYFVFGVCGRCWGRLKRLPDSVQNRQLLAAIGQISKHPERYDYQTFQERAAAAIYARLSSND